MRNLVAGLALAAVVALGIWWYMGTQNKDKSETPANNQTATQSGSKSTEIVFDGSSFSPKSVSVGSGAKVIIRNNSGRTIEFNSDPHPIHTNNSDLNLGAISPGGSREVTLTKKGTWGYHDHLNSVLTGSIIVR